MINRAIVVALVFIAGCATGQPATSAGSGGSEGTRATPTARTPYTAEQIRGANPPGTRLVFRMERVGEPTVLNVTTFVGGDAEHAVMERRVTSLESEPLGEVARSTATWTELRDHAAFPADRTRRKGGSVTVPAGTFPVWRYIVTGDPEHPGKVTEFSFARNRPGPPVLMVEKTDGEVTLRMVLVEDSRGG